MMARMESATVYTDHEAATIARACPVCPQCKSLLIARPSHRRFQEDDNYVECLRGHVWELVTPRD